MRQIAIEIETPAYTTSNSHKYMRWLETRMMNRRTFSYMKWEFQLYRGGEKFPRTQVMTAREMTNRNNRFAMSFAAKVEAEPSRRLWEWRHVNCAEYNIQRMVLSEGLRHRGENTDPDKVMEAIRVWNEKRFAENENKG